MIAPVSPYTQRVWNYKAAEEQKEAMADGRFASTLKHLLHDPAAMNALLATVTPNCKRVEYENEVEKLRAVIKTDTYNNKTDTGTYIYVAILSNMQDPELRTEPANAFIATLSDLYRTEYCKRRYGEKCFEKPVRTSDEEMAAELARVKMEEDEFA